MKKTVVLMAALAVMCYTSAFAAAGTCQDWEGVWQFTYDNATQVNICFDNSTITADNIDLCDDDAAENCQCINDITGETICIDNSTFEQCDNDSAQDCVCIDNPFFKDPSVDNGNYEVIIDDVQENVNVTLEGGDNITLLCVAKGTRTTDSQPVFLAAPDNDTIDSIGAGLSYGTYFYFEAAFEAATFDAEPFSQILAEDFFSDNFTARSDFNFLGLVSGSRTGDLPIGCEVTVTPKKISRFFTFLSPIVPFVISADQASDVEFARPIAIDWGTENINTFIRSRIGNRIIVGFMFVRPFRVEPGDYEVTVTYGDDDSTCAGSITVQ